MIQVENMLQNVFINMKDWRMALDCLQRIIDLAPDIASTEAAQLLLHQRQSKISNTVDTLETLVQALTVAYRLEFISRQCRILLQTGALDQAGVLLQQARSEWKMFHPTVSSSQNGSLRSAIISLVAAQLSSIDGLLKFSFGHYEEALEAFRTVIQELRSVRAIRGNEQQQKHHPFESLHTSLYSETINNMALCALYTCRLQEALQLMESLVRENVTAYLTERVALNLCTLYELSMDSNSAIRKKQVLQLIANRFLLQDIGVECFRVS
jgi:tetratricopeptide (TPR) repeat protein